MVSAESEISVAELLGERFSVWCGITIHPRYPPPTDVDISIQGRGFLLNVQVKTFEFYTSRYGARVAEGIRNWDTSVVALGENAYVARRYVGADLVSEAVRPVAGVGRLARVGALHFEPSSDDLKQMRRKVIDALDEAQRQLHEAPPPRIVLFDVRRSYVDSETLYRTVNYHLRTRVSAPSCEAAVMLTYEFEPGPSLSRIMAPVWIHPDHQSALTLFRPPRPIQLVRGRPFAMPVHLNIDKPGWQDLLALDQGTIKIDGVPYGTAFP